MKERRKPTNEVRLVLPSNSINEGFARGVSAAFVSQVNPSITELSDVKCAVSEAVTNCIVHAYADTIGLIYITMKLYENREFRIEIKDKGCGIPDVKQARAPLYTTDAAGERSGMGFTVMESFTDALRVTSKVGKGTTVTMFKKFSDRGRI
jgi:stage II sporulation protein AB (anti-sigma F factor)